MANQTIVPNSTAVRADRQADITGDTLRTALVKVNANFAEGTNTASVALTNAEVLALRATPKTLVPAPPVGYAIEFLGATLALDYGGTQYTESADNLAIRYTDGSGAIASQAIEMTGFIDQAADTFTNALPKIDTIVAKTGIDARALVLHNTGDGEFGGGNAATVLRVNVRYRLVALGW